MPRPATGILDEEAAEVEAAATDEEMPGLMDDEEFDRSQRSRMEGSETAPATTRSRTISGDSRGEREAGRETATIKIAVGRVDATTTLSR